MSISSPGTVVIISGSEFSGLHQDIEEERTAAAPSGTYWSDIRRYRLYDRGKQADTLSPQQRRMLRGVLGNPFADNAVHKVVTEHANRVVMTGWACDAAPVRTYLEELWVKNAGPDFTADRNYATIRDGNHAVGLRWHTASGRVILAPERWWDGTSGMYVAYDDDGQPAYAVKDWKAGENDRRTVYYDDRIERYISKGGIWERFTLPGDTAWPMPWVKRDGSPLHIPVIHLAAISDDDTPYGASIMAGGVLGLQDDINDVQRDITMAARMTAYQMYWATGVTAEVDAAGEAVATEVGPGMFLQNDNENAKYGVLPAGDMSQLIAAHTLKSTTLAQNTSTPVHLITGGDWPSGEALLRADVPLQASAKRVVDSVEPAWATVGHRSTEVRNAFTVGAALDESVLITAEFNSTDLRDELTMSQVDHEKVNVLIALKGLGFSESWLMGRYGLSDAEITKIQQDKLDETTRTAEANLALETQI